jgi:hypothetical protein
VIHHVVVHEGGGVEQFQHAAHVHRSRPPVPGEPRRHQEQDRAQALAARARDEPADLADEPHRRADLRRDHLVDRTQLGADRGRDALLQEGVPPGGCLHREEQDSRSAEPGKGGASSRVGARET